MASTYTDRLGLEKQTDGENPNSWGAILNTNVIDLIDDAIAGYEIVSVSSTGITLTDNIGSTDQSRNAALEFAGTLTANVTITVPAEEKTYFIRENTSGSFAVQMKTDVGTALTLSQGANTFVACNGTSIYRIDAPTSVTSFTANTLTANTLIANNNVGIGTTSPGAKLDVVGGYATLGDYNSAGQATPRDAAISFSTNITNGQAESDVWNGINPATYANTGILFTQRLSSSTRRDLMFLHNSGNVGIGTTSPSYKLHVDGDIYATGNITAYSAAAAKADIVTIANPLDLVSKLRGVSFRWKDSGKLAQGLIYEEVAKIIPEVTSNHGGAVGIQYQNLVAVLIESVKALKAEIDELKARY
jgi:hypothetical protein